MKKKTVLVSGGAGYIGSHTAVELINAGLNVVVADNLSNSDMSGVEGVRKITGVDVPFVNVDCCDKEAFRKVFEQYEFDSVLGPEYKVTTFVLSVTQATGEHSVTFTRTAMTAHASAAATAGIEVRKYEHSTPPQTQN